MQGPLESPYAGGIFVIDFMFEAQYPFKAPKINFVTKIYHPNVKTDTGEICADVINANWGPTLNVLHCLKTLQSMLSAPNADSPVEEEVRARTPLPPVHPSGIYLFFFDINSSSPPPPPPPPDCVAAQGQPGCFRGDREGVGPGPRLWG